MLADAVRELVASYAEEARRSGVEQRSIRAARDRPHLNRARLEQHLVQHGCERLREAGATMSICRDLGVDLPRDLS